MKFTGNSTSSARPQFDSLASLAVPSLRLPTPVKLFFITYTVALACLLDFQLLWLDEIIQLLGTRSGTLEHIDQLTRTGVGGVPLGWLPQLLAIRVLGYSIAAARLPSAIAAIGSCLVVLYIARQLRLRYPLVPAVLLSAMPLFFRYALEGRPYTQGVLLSALVTLAFIKLLNRQSLQSGVTYALVLVLAMYSQPFACFTACAHLVWVLIMRRQQHRLVCFTGCALVLMVLTFLPWYAYAAPMWRETIQSDGLQLHLTSTTPLMVIRELTGAGYFGGGTLLLLAAVGFYRGGVTTPMKWLLLACSAVPALCVFIVDAFFGYFFAIRQMIFILPPLVLLAADGLIALVRAGRRVGVATTLLTIIFVFVDAHWLRKPREDWKLAARTIEQLRNEHSACVLSSPYGTLPYYSFYEPALDNSICRSSNPFTSEAVVLVISPYTTEQERRTAQELVRGKQIVASQSVGMSMIQVYGKSVE